MTNPFTPSDTPPSFTARKRGRPEGSVSKLAREARELAQQTGELPHEILLKMARGYPTKTFVVQTDKDGNPVLANGEPVFVAKYVALDGDAVRDAAKAAAPYYAPKISMVELIPGASDDDLDAFIKSAAAQAGISLSSDGEGEEEEAPGPTSGRKRLNASA